MNETIDSTKVRRLPRVSMRTLLFGIAILGTLFAVIANYVHFHESRLRALEEVESSAMFMNNSDFGWESSEWLGALTPMRYQKALTSVVLFDSISSPPLSTFDFGNLSYFPELQELGINAQTTERQLLELPPLRRLVSLELETDGATDAVVCRICQHSPHLQSLYLDSEVATDRSIACISRLEELVEINIVVSASMSPDALRALCSRPNIDYIWIVDPPGVLRQEDLDILRDVLPPSAELEYDVDRLIERF